jgi:hypothetical protein
LKKFNCNNIPLHMAPPPPALPNGNLSNGITNNIKPANTIAPSNHAGLLKEIETGKNCQFLVHVHL